MLPRTELKPLPKVLAEFVDGSGEEDGFVLKDSLRLLERLFWQYWVDHLTY